MKKSLSFTALSLLIAAPLYGMDDKTVPVSYCLRYSLDLTDDRNIEEMYRPYVNETSHKKLDKKKESNSSESSPNSSLEDLFPSATLELIQASQENSEDMQ